MHDSGTGAEHRITAHAATHCGGMAAMEHDGWVGQWMANLAAPFVAREDMNFAKEAGSKQTGGYIAGR